MDCVAQIQRYLTRIAKGIKVSVKVWNDLLEV
jgi:hypothetical protein